MSNTPLKGGNLWILNDRSLILHQPLRHQFTVFTTQAVTVLKLDIRCSQSVPDE